MGLTPNCSHKVRSMKLSEVPQHAGALTVPFTRTCRAQLLRKQTPHLNPPLCQTFFYLAQRSQTTPVLLGQPPNPDSCIALLDSEAYSVPPEIMSPIAPEFSGPWVSPGCIWHFAWHLVMRGLDTAVWPWKEPSQVLKILSNWLWLVKHCSRAVIGILFPEWSISTPTFTSKSLCSFPCSWPWLRKQTRRFGGEQGHLRKGKESLSSLSLQLFLRFLYGVHAGRLVQAFCS